MSTAPARTASDATGSRQRSAAPAIPRRQLAGTEAITTALRETSDVRLLLVRADDDTPQTRALVELAQTRGVRVWRGSAGDLRRMGRGPQPQRAVALLGPPIEAALDELLTRGGATWLLHQAAYPSNVGFAVRTAEVSGAAGVIVDARWNHADRARVDHVSMGATRLLPVLFHASADAVARAKRHGVRVYAIEDVGDRAPWQVDLSGPVLCVIGSERAGIDPQLLATCDAVVRIPMAGFVPSYNVQAAMAAVAIERLRQLDAR